MGLRKKKPLWFPLDNAAKIYPSISNESKPHVFSFSAILFEQVHSEQLSLALKNVLKANPLFKTRLMRGKFWYYLEENFEEPIVFREKAFFLRAIDYKETNGYLFKVSFVDSRITIVFFHALTDGTGGFNFFSQLLFEYFQLMNYKIDSEGLIRSVDSPFFFDESDDSYLTYNEKPTKILSKKVKQPYIINGTPFGYLGVGIITAKIDLDQLKTVAKTFNSSITSYLSGLYIYTIYNVYLKEKPVKNKLINILIPCNLRKKYGGKTMRNFTMFARICKDFSKENVTLEDCVKYSQEQILEQLSIESLDNVIHQNVKKEKNPFIKLSPLCIKDLLIKLIYSKIGENLQTSLLSNLGAVNLPNSFQSYVKHLTFMLAPSSTCRQQVGVIGYNGSIYVTFTRGYVENKVEQQFIKALSDEGLNVTVFSNNWECEP